MMWLRWDKYGSARLGSARLGSARLGSARLGSALIAALLISCSADEPRNPTAEECEAAAAHRIELRIPPQMNAADRAQHVAAARGAVGDELARTCVQEWSREQAACVRNAESYEQAIACTEHVK